MKMNNNILKTTYVFMLLFAILIIYMFGYILIEAPEDINNPYNKRQEALVQKVVRGNIYSKDMEILATTVMDNGDEIRLYPYDNLFCHAVGSSDMGNYSLESSYNFELLSTEVSVIDEVKAELNNKKLLGNNIVTTLDVGLQQAVYDALGEYEGAVVVMNPENGNILSLVSKPDYNPNCIKELWEEIKDSDKGNLINRATQGLYPPGSTFKIFTLGAYIESHKKSYNQYEYNCEGTISFQDYSVSCSNKRPHGKVGIAESFANSCNCAFVNMGTMVDSDRLNAYCKDLLFNSELPLEIPYKRSSMTLSSMESEFMKSQTVIGQGETLVTPVHMCMIMSSLANEGVLMKPRLVTEITDYAGNCVKSIREEEYMELYTKEETDVLNEYLRQVVISGTASRLYSDEYDVYGKTGTAQISVSGKADSWFVGAVSFDDETTYSMAVLLESVDENTSPAIVVTKEIIKYLDKTKE